MNTTTTHSNFVRVAVGAIVALLGALLITLGAPIADAAPPKVKASENPVLIPWTQPSKDIQLTWDLESWQPLENLLVTDSGNPVPEFNGTVSNFPGDSRTLKVKAVTPTPHSCGICSPCSRSVRR